MIRLIFFLIVVAICVMLWNVWNVKDGLVVMQMDGNSGWKRTIRKDKYPLVMRGVEEDIIGTELIEGDIIEGDKWFVVLCQCIEDGIIDVCNPLDKNSYVGIVLKKGDRLALPWGWSGVLGEGVIIRTKQYTLLEMLSL